MNQKHNYNGNQRKFKDLKSKNWIKNEEKYFEE